MGPGAPATRSSHARLDFVGVGFRSDVLLSGVAREGQPKKQSIVLKPDPTKFNRPAAKLGRPPMAIADISIFLCISDSIFLYILHFSISKVKISYGDGGDGGDLMVVVMIM